MRRLPTFLYGLFLVITLARVASFSGSAMQAGWLGWPFSVGLGLAVYACAYNLRVHLRLPDGSEDRRSRNVRLVAGVGLVLFVAADGAFNLWDVLGAVKAPELQAAAWIYGLFPTLAAALLGILQGVVDKLPVPPARTGVRVAMRAWLVSQFRVPALPAEEPVTPVLLPVASEAQPVRARYVCGECGYATDSQRAYAGHGRKHSLKARK